MGDNRKIDITEAVLHLTKILAQGGRGFEAGLALAADKQKAVAMAAGAVVAGAALERIVDARLLLRNEGRRDRVLEVLRDHGLDRAYGVMLNMGDDRRTSVIVSAMATAELMRDDRTKAEALLEFCCKEAFQDAYTVLSIDLDRLRAVNPPSPEPSI